MVDNMLTHLSVLQLRKVSPRNPPSRWGNGQCRQLSVSYVYVGGILHRFSRLPFWQRLLKHRPVSKEIIMFVDEMNITKLSVISASVKGMLSDPTVPWLAFACRVDCF